MVSRAAPLPALLSVALLALSSRVSAQAPLHKGFVDAAEVVPSLVVDVRYATENNFVGRPVDGYAAPRCVITSEAAAALKGVQDELVPYGLSLKVFDAYRPQTAVDHFVRWSQDAADLRTKAEYYPDVAKQELFREGYIASRSSHSRGSTVDLTIVSLVDGEAGEELDMGTPFDFFGHQSWVDSAEVTPQQRANRLLLRGLMLKHGFRPYNKEWWHFTLVDEPFPRTYFDFPVN